MSVPIRTRSGAPVVRVTACTNQKGGVGKTTTVVNLAAYLALSGTSTLVIDLDPQGNATSGFGIDRRALDRSVYDALVDRAPISEQVVGTPIDGLDLVPSAPSLSGAEVELVNVAARERRLAASLAQLNGRYERVIIDCPPSLGLLTVNALTAADGVLIPIQTEYYALEGLSQLVHTIRLVRQELNPRLEIDGVVLTMYDARTNLAAQVADEVRRHMRDAVYETVVPRSVRLSEAPSHGLPIALYDPVSRGARAYRELAGEVAARG
jgi:chromosome partitioning protein